MGWTRTFLEGVAQLLADDDVAAWNPTGKYTAGTTGIYLIGIPDAAASGIALAHYTVDDTVHGHGVQGVQVRCRGNQDPRVAQDLADAVYETLHGLQAVTLPGGVHVARAWQQSHSPIGTDSAGRWETSSNFYALTDRPNRNAD